MPNKAVRPVILCGGKGSRLWPLSRELYPKQFMEIAGDTLFAQTVQRARIVCPDSRLIILCNQEHRFFASEILKGMGVDADIIVEPSARDTGPAIALASLCACEKSPGSLLLVMPSDHCISEAISFSKCVGDGVGLALNGHIVTFGICPSRPESSFGYIKHGNALGGSGFSVERFVEKPSTDIAAFLIAEGGYSWNSGIFLFEPSTYLMELEAHRPSISAACAVSWDSREERAEFIYIQGKHYDVCESDSIDYAVMEHTARAAVVPMEIVWSDLGSWEAFYDSAPHDASANVQVGDIVCRETEGCYLHSTHRLIATLGVKDLVVVETGDAILVLDRKRSQDVKALVGDLKVAKREEVSQHTRVYRPWGTYEVMALSERFQVKRLVVKPGGILSLQHHHHRAEHWVVVSGTAKVTVGDRVCMLTEDQSTYIPVGSVHRLENPGRIPLEIIEVQTGAYLGEDDIVRHEDTYGRGQRKGQQDPLVRPS